MDGLTEDLHRMRISNWKDTAGVDGHGEISNGKPGLTKICSATDDDHGTYCQLFKKKSVLSFQTSLSLQIKLRSQITRGDTTHFAQRNAGAAQHNQQTSTSADSV
jgi:hypothetical protein